MSNEDVKKFEAMKVADLPEEQSITETSDTSLENSDKVGQPAEQETNTNDTSTEKTETSGILEESLTGPKDTLSEKTGTTTKSEEQPAEQSLEESGMGEPVDDSKSDEATTEESAGKSTGGGNPLASEESDSAEDGDLVPSNDYERFLSQFANADMARRMLLHCINARVAEHEHKANCWKVVQIEESLDLKKMFEIFMKKEGAPTVDEFENNAFMKSYARPEYVPETDNTSYAEYMEQFLPGIPIRNYFPELGPVAGEVPFSMSTDSDMMVPQPPIVLDPKCYELKFKKVKQEKLGKNNKKTTITKTEVVHPEPMFSADDLTQCVAVPEWAERYSGQYCFQPAKELILRELDPKRYKTVSVPPRSVECGLISQEFNKVLAEYQKATNPQMLALAPSLAKKYIEKRLEQLDSSIDPTIIKTYEKMKSVLNDEIVAAVNAINRHRSDEKKFDRLEKILYIKYYDL